MDSEILQSLGRIEGSLKEIKDTAKEHREDDTRRFTDVYAKLERQSEDINRAKGAKGAIMAMAAVVSALAGIAIAAVQKLFTH